MSATYFWYRDKLVVIDRQILFDEFGEEVMRKYKYCPCVDAYESRPSMRYGFYAVDDTLHDWQAVWESRTLEGFPDEFRAHLLLLGVL
jgi:hypothetical protein